MAFASAETLSQDVFTKLRILIIANKPTYVYNGITFTYTMVAEYPKDNPTFPVVVLNESSVNVVLLTFDGSGRDYGVEVQLDFYAKEAHGKKAIDAGRDSLRNTFINNISEFINTDGLIPMDDFWDDSNIASLQESKNQIINTGSSLLKFMLK